MKNAQECWRQTGLAQHVSRTSYLPIPLCGSPLNRACSPSAWATESSGERTPEIKMRVSKWRALNSLLSPFVVGESTVPCSEQEGSAFPPGELQHLALAVQLSGLHTSPAPRWLKQPLLQLHSPRGYPRGAWGRARAVFLPGFSEVGKGWFFDLGRLFFLFHLFAYGFDLAVAYNRTLGRKEA